MRIRIELGQWRSIELEHIMENIYQVINLHGKVKVEADVGDMVKKTNKGWIVYRNPEMSIPKYRIPSNVKTSSPYEGVQKKYLGDEEE